MKLVAIGDSITQGFMSGAAARTDLAYPSLIARAMQLSVGSHAHAQFKIPQWPENGLPVNLEALARRIMKSSVGSRIDLWDWPQLINRVRDFMDDVEDYYERGDGRPDKTFGVLSEFHNLAVQGMDVADVWQVTPSLCREQIALEKKGDKDDLFGFPSAAFYRTALNVLDPQRTEDPQITVLDKLQSYARGEGVENVTLWLGANNALGTVTQLKIEATNGPKSDYAPTMTRPMRQRFNLWGPEHFNVDYTLLLDKIDEIMQSNVSEDWRVFIGTVPPVSVAPLTTGVGETYQIDDPFKVIEGTARYSKFYTYFLFDEDYAARTKNKLTFSEILQIDRFISQYNETIKALIAKKNTEHKRTGYKKDRYILVDTCKMLLQAAFKRNNMQPTYEWPPEVASRMPMVDTRFHHAEKGDHQIEQGGIFGLDGIHPTAIGQGLIAHEFINAINAARGTDYSLDWDAIYESDRLYMEPITLMGSIRNKAEDMGKFLVWATALKGRGERAR